MLPPICLSLLNIRVGANSVIKPKLGPLRPFVVISQHNANSAASLFYDEVKGPKFNL